MKVENRLRILPSGLLINPLLGRDTCCCLPSSGSRLVCWPPQNKYSAFCFLIGIPRGGGRGVAWVAWRKSHQNVQVLPSSSSEVHQPITQRCGPSAERLDYDSRHCLVNTLPSALIPPLHVQIDCKPLQSFRPSNKKGNPTQSVFDKSSSQYPL